VSGRSLALVALLALLAPVALAQSSPVIVRDVSPSYHVLVERDATVTLEWNVRNLNPAVVFLVNVSVADIPGWRESLEPAGEFYIAANSTKSVALRLVPEDPTGRVAFNVAFAIYDLQTGAVTNVVREASVSVPEEPLVFGLFANPLPAPFDGSMGVLLIDLAIVIAAALATNLATDLLIRSLTRAASATTTRHIIQKMRRSVFLFAVFFALHHALAGLPGGTVADGAAALAELLYTLFGAFVAYKLIDSLLYYYGVEIAPRTSTDLDDILVPTIRKVALVVVSVVGALAILNALNVDLTFFVAGGAIVSLVIAFAAQDTLSNFFSGIFLLVDRPFKERDDIKLESGEIARVDRIGLRSTRLYHYANHETIVVPNNRLASTKVVNLTEPDTMYRMNVIVGVAYDTDLPKAEEILLRVSRETPGVLLDAARPPVVLVDDFAESSINMKLVFFVTDFRQRFAVATEVRKRIHKAFDAEGIEIPFPQRTLWIKDGRADVPR